VGKESGGGVGVGDFQAMVVLGHPLKYKVLYPLTHQPNCLPKLCHIWSFVELPQQMPTTN
jgi:hypothetical protein